MSNITFNEEENKIFNQLLSNNEKYFIGYYQSANTLKALISYYKSTYNIVTYDVFRGLFENEKIIIERQQSQIKKLILNKTSQVMFEHYCFLNSLNKNRKYNRFVWNNDINLLALFLVHFKDECNHLNITQDFLSRLANEYFYLKTKKDAFNKTITNVINLKYHDPKKYSELETELQNILGSNDFYDKDHPLNDEMFFYIHPPFSPPFQK